MTTVDTRTGRFYHPELDILRFFAFLAVFMHHALPQAPGAYPALGSLAPWVASVVLAGGFGVDLFFALSSYLITELLIREYKRRGSIDIRAFYIRRALRIWPLYFAFLAFVIVVVPYILPNDTFPPIYRWTFLVFLGNWSTALLGYPNSVAAPLWSVSVEEQFYIVWPAAIALLGVQRIGRFAVGALIVAWLTRLVLVGIGAEHPAIWANTFARLDSIALGALLAVWLRGGAPVIRTSVRVVLIAGATIVMIVTARYLRLDGPTSLLLFPLIATASAVILASVLRQSLRSFPGMNIGVLLGKVSYGLYVFHVFALHVASLIVADQATPRSLLLRGLIGFLVTVSLALISYQFLELPFLHLKQRFAHVSSRPD